MTKTTAVLCSLLLGLTACGGGEEDEARENIKANILENGDSALSGGGEVTEEQATCLSDGLVDDVGVDNLQEYGLLNDDLEIDENADPTDLSADDADALAGVIVGCVDFGELVTEQMAGAAGELSDGQRTCVEDALDDDAFVKALSATFQGKDEDAFGADLQGEMMACMTG